MAHTCRGTIPLATAHIEVGETCHFVLTSGGRSYHLKATSEGECQRWVSALQQAKASATLLMPHSGRRGLWVVKHPRCGSWVLSRTHINSIKRLKHTKHQFHGSVVLGLCGRAATRGRGWTTLPQLGVFNECKMSH